MAKAYEVGEYIYILEEKWKSLVFEGEYTVYEVSNTGKVRNSKTGKLLSHYTDKDGYLHTTIMFHGKLRHKGVHRYVATAFIENPENKPQVNHINGNKKDNFYLNLEWMTGSENVKHAFKAGLKHSSLGSDNSLSCYTDKQIHDVCRYLQLGMKQTKIANKTGVNYKYISDIKYGRRWKHVSSQYNFSIAR